MTATHDHIKALHPSERSPLEQVIHHVYEAAHDPRLVDIVYDYHRRHKTPSLCILTLCEPQPAEDIAAWLDPVIRGRTVTEVGAGVGLLALAMAKRAKSVVAIEVDPAWSWAFTKRLYAEKPPNLAWVFGRAELLADLGLRTEVGVFVTRSGAASMAEVAGRIALTVYDVIGETGV